MDYNTYAGPRIVGVSADEMIDAVQPHNTDHDKVDGNDVVQRLRHNQDQDACGEGNDRRNVCSVKGHNDLLGGWNKRHPPRIVIGKA